MAKEQHARRFILILLVAAMALTIVVITPFWAAFFIAAVLAATLRRPMEALARRLGGRRQLAAGILTLAVLLLLVVPVAGFGALLVNQVLDGVQWLREAIQSEGVWGLIRRLPGPVEDVARRALEALPDPQRQLQQIAGSQGGQAAAAVGGVLAATTNAVFQTVMMLIALFFFLSDGPKLIDWLDARVPLRPGQFRQLIDDFRKTSVSVILATVATAGIQTGTAVVGYLIARAPNVIFLTFATFVVALIPALGGAVMVNAVGLLLLATGHMLAGIFLLVWGAVVVSLIDNVARPFLLKGGMALHGGVVFFSLLGGLAVFGGIGLVLGPLVLTFLLTTVQMYRREFAGAADREVEPDARTAAAPGAAPPEVRLPPAAAADGADAGAGAAR